MKVDEYLLNINNAIQYGQEITLPEKTLLAAVLQRAVRDLGSPFPLKDKKEVISWFKFKGPKKKEASCFYFKDCVDILELSSWQIKLIFDYIEHLETSHGEFKTKGETDRVRNRPLAPGARFTFGKEDTTVQRKRTRFSVRYSGSRRPADVAHRMQRNAEPMPQPLDTYKVG